MQRTRLLSWLMLISLILSACSPWSSKPSPTPGVAEDVWPPTVVEIQPADGQEVTPDATIRIRFDQPMDRRRTEAALSIEPDLSGTFLWQDVRTLMFRPRTALKEGTTYRVRLKASARSLAGATLLQPLEFSFSTPPSLQVAHLVPENGAKDLRVDSPIQISFNQAIVPESCVGQTAGNRAKCPELPITIDPPALLRGRWLAPALYEFTAYPGWNAGTLYRFTLRGEIQSLTGARAQVDTSSSFTTSRPQVLRVEPLAQQTAELPPETHLRIVFNNPMDPRATAEAFSLTAEDGTNVPGSLTWNEDTTILTFTPLRPLALGTRYVLRLTQRARAITTAPLEQEQAWSFTTVSIPTITLLYPPDGAKDVPLHSSVRFAVRGSWDEATLRAGLTLSPTVEGLEFRLQDDVLALNWKRAPRTTYCVSLPAGLRDRYNQELRRGVSTCFSTGGQEARFEPAIPGEPLVIDATVVARLSFLMRNVTRISFQLYRVDEMAFMTNAPLGDKPLRDWVERFTVTEPDVFQVVSVDLMRGNPLRSGYYQLRWTDPVTGDWRQIRLAVVDRRLNVLLGREEAQVWLTDLHTSDPITGVQVRLLDRGVLLAAGTTNAEGLVQLRFEPRDEIYSPLFVVTGEPGNPGFGLVATTWHHQTAPWDFGLTAQYDRFPSAVIWGLTDKSIYAPLEKIQLAGLMRQSADALYTLPSSNQRLQVVLETIQHTPVYSGTAIADAQGFFATEITLPYNISAGSYRLKVTHAATLAQWESLLQILPAEEEEPFHVDLLLPEAPLVLNTPLTVTVRAAYPNGVPVFKAQGRWEVWRETEQLAAATLSLDQEGQARFLLPRPLSLPANAETWLLLVYLTDSWGHSTTQSRLITVHPTAISPEIRLKSAVGAMRQAVSVDVRAVDINGQAVAGEPLTVTLVQRLWQAPASNVPALSQAWQVEESKVQQTTLTSAEDWSSINLVPPAAGDYVVRVTGAITREVPLYVSGKQAGSWRQGAAQLVPQADKERYRAGETARILLPLPSAAPCRVLMTVMRDGIILKRFFDFNEATPVVVLPLSQEFVPDVYVTFTVFYPGENPELRTGHLHLLVEPVLQTLTVSLETDRPTYAPDEEVRLKVRVRSASDQPVAGVRIFLVVREALPTQKTPSHSLLERFYQHPLPMIGGDTLDVLMERWVPLVQQLKTISATSWLETVTQPGSTQEIVHNPQDAFLPPQTALLWRPDLTTNAAGEIEVNFQLPHRSGTWEIQAFAMADAAALGETRSLLSVQEPFALTPLLPPALSAGDEITLGLRVDNLTGSLVTPTLKLDVEGAQLTSSPSVTAVLAPQAGAFYTWTLKVPPQREEALTLRFEALLESEAGSWITRTLAIRAPRTFSYPVLAGILKDTTPWRASFYVPEKAEAGTTLRVEVYPSLKAWLTAQAPLYAEWEEADLEARALRLLALVSTRSATPTAVEELYPYQHANGGWGFWPQDEASSPHESALITWALLEAQRAGQAIDAQTLQKGLTYLAQHLTRAVRDKACAPEQALALLVLATARFPWPDEAPQLLYTCRQNLGITGQAYLALALGQIDPADPRIKPLLEGLMKARNEVGIWDETNAQAHITPEWASAAASLALITLKAQGTVSEELLTYLINPVLPPRAKALALLATRRYLDGQPEAGQPRQVAWRLLLNGEVLEESPEQSQSYVSDIPLEALRPGETQHLELNWLSGSGPLYYIMYLKTASSPAELPRGIQIKRSYCQLQDAVPGLCQELSQLAPGEEVQVRLRLTVPTTRTQVMVTDPYPAGLSPVLASASATDVPFNPVFQEAQVQFHAPLLPPGVYEVRYLLRADFTGRFLAPAAAVYELYGPLWGVSQPAWIEVTRVDPSQNP